MAERRSPGVASPQARGGLGALMRLLPFLAPHRMRLVLALIMLLAAAATGLALPVAVRQVIDGGFSAGASALIDKYFLALLALCLALAVFSAARFYLVSWLGERVVADVRSALYQHVLGLGPAFYEVTRSGEVLSRLTTDTTLVQAVSGVNLSITLRSAITLLGALVMLLATSPRLTAFVLALIPLVLVPVIIIGRRVRRLTRATQDRVAEASGIAGETLEAIQLVQAYTLEDSQSRRFDDAVETSFDAGVARIRARALLAALAISMVFGAVILVLWIGAQSVIAGEMTPGQLGQFVLFALMVAGSAASLSEMWSEIQRAAGALERIDELFHARAEIREPEQPVLLPSPARGALTVGGVDFRYPSRAETLALSDVDISIAPGETVALVGPSGAGKSTLFQLLLRFYDPERGRILVDGIDIRNLSLRALRGAIALVPQDTVIFADTVRENIRRGRPDADDDAVLAAARAAGVDEFVRQLPDGYETALGERGTRLSGGQRQRIAIARALIKRPAILLLDEATSALDARTERLVQSALEELMRDCTTLVIAHRLSTVLAADRIVVLDAGRVVAMGDHASLMRTSPLYTRLAALEFQHADA